MERSRPERPEWPDLLGWFPGWAHWPGFRGLMESAVEGVEPMRIEEHVEDNQLIVKAELPASTRTRMWRSSSRIRRCTSRHTVAKRRRRSTRATTAASSATAGSLAAFLSLIHISEPTRLG